MKNVKRHVFWFGMSGLAFVVGAAATYFQHGAYAQEIQEQKRLSKLVVSPADVQAERDKTARELAEAQARLEHLERGVSEMQYVPTLLKELEAFGKEHDIEVLGVRPMPSQEPAKTKTKRRPKDYVEIMIEVKGRGMYEAVNRFVADLQKFPKIVAARTVSLSPKSDPAQPDTLALDVTIELKAYLFPPSKAQASDSGAPADVAARR